MQMYTHMCARIVHAHIKNPKWTINWQNERLKCYLQEYWAGVGTASLCIFRGLLQILKLNSGDLKEGDFML